MIARVEAAVLEEDAGVVVVEDAEVVAGAVVKFKTSVQDGLIIKPSSAKNLTPSPLFLRRNPIIRFKNRGAVWILSCMCWHRILFLAG